MQLLFVSAAPSSLQAGYTFLRTEKTNEYSPEFSMSYHEENKVDHDLNSTDFAALFR